MAVTRGERVLVVEADFEPGAPGHRGVEGLADVLAGSAPLGKAVIHDPSSGARLLPLGDPLRLSRAGLDRTNIERFLHRGRSDFDLVLIDGGALATNLRMNAMAAASDRLLVVARNGTTRQRDLLDVIDVAEMAGRSPSGAVLVGAAAA